MEKSLGACQDQNFYLGKVPRIKVFLKARKEKIKFVRIFRKLGHG